MLEADGWLPLRGGESEDLLGPLDREPLAKARRDGALAVLVMV